MKNPENFYWRLLIIICALLFLTIVLNRCAIKQDMNDAPDDLNHRRLPISINGKVELGIHGTILENPTLYVRSYGLGVLSLHGDDDCGFYDGWSIDTPGWYGFNFPKIQKEVCIYRLQEKTQHFDAPISGIILHARLKDPLYWRWLRVIMNNTERDGLGWVQVAEENETVQDYSEKENNSFNGIYESRDIILKPYGTRGHIRINGCGGPEFNFDYENGESVKLEIDDLFKDKIVKGSCIFTVISRTEPPCPDDFCMNERAFLYVNAYKKHGSFLAGPIVTSEFGKVCFDFKDPFVVATRANKKYSNKNKICVENTAIIEVEAITSVLREFFGICKYANETCDWEIK